MDAIYEPIDKVFSTEGTEWHGKADHRPEGITDDVVEPILFPIEEFTPNITDGGETFTMGGFKSVVADLRHRDDLKEVQVSEDEDGEPVMGDLRMLPLHMAKESYTVIENRDLWEMTRDALRGVDSKISCVGTLGKCQYFFISVILGDEPTFKVNGDEFAGNFNVITSHNGTMAVEAYDSLTRIVCMNTLKWSRSRKGELDFKVYHSKNSALAIRNMGDIINDILSGRVEFRNQMEFLADRSCTETLAREIIAGWLTKGKKEMTTRGANRTDEIVRLFKYGQGNKGKTFYDLLNGVTEYFTSGEGTGKDASTAKKWAKSEFGAAADHKRDMVNLLTASDDDIRSLAERGKKMIKEFGD